MWGNTYHCPSLQQRRQQPAQVLDRVADDARLAAALGDTELLAMVLRSGTRGQDVLTLSIRLITEAGSLAGLIAWREQDYRKLKGIGRVNAPQLFAVMEIARGVITQHAGEEPIRNRADLILAYLRSLVLGLEVEKLSVLCLNRKNRLLKRVELSSGRATAALAHPRECFARRCANRPRPSSALTIIPAAIPRRTRPICR